MEGQTQQVSPLLQNAYAVLSDTFGFEAFRHAQQDIITSILSGHNTLAIMPTGGGKSLCYQIPALVFDGVTLVISPLISLMQDQVHQLHQLGVSAVMLNSSLSSEAYQHNVDAISNNDVKLVFLAPETALQSASLTLFRKLNISLIAIDEAHCISEWGHEFRPEYRQLSQVKSHFPDAVCIGLTATATSRVRLDIKQQLDVQDTNEYVSSFDRPNLFIEVVAKQSPYSQTKAFIEQHQGQSGIIYCQSRSGVDELSDLLAADGFSVRAYHAGLNSQKRAQYQDAFIRDDAQIIVATVAFGMGINKPDVRFVVHYDLPKNIESYYQQIGRAGRDGDNANCLLLFGYGDIGKIRYFIDNMQNEQEARLASQHLQNMLALAETEDCRRLPLLQYFGESPRNQNCAMCDNCLSGPQEKQDLTVAAQKFLSCVHRTGQRFGAGHIIDVLRGSNSEKVLQNQHNLLSTYNIGQELSKKQWMTLSRKLVQQSLLTTKDPFGGLTLTQKASDVLKGNVPFYALLEADTSSRKGNASAKGHAHLEADQVLLQQLKEVRKRLADQHNVPPYAILSDRSLQEIAHYYPHSHESLLKIHGLGHAKLDSFGSTILEIVTNYCTQYNRSERENTGKVAANKASSKAQSVGGKSIQICQQFDEGYTIEALAHRHKVKTTTIFGHLYKYVQHGHKLQNISQLENAIQGDSGTLDEAFAAFETHGTQKLKPIFEALGQRCDYDQLHLIRVLYLNSAT